jgi:protein-tyrosine-phosphatase
MAQRGEKSVLFLCTGNYFRSRFAEILFNSVAGKMGLPWKASSKGLALEQGVNNVGSMADGRIEIQGDQREHLVAVLEDMGYRVKRVGG